MKIKNTNIPQFKKDEGGYITGISLTITKLIESLAEYIANHDPLHWIQWEIDTITHDTYGAWRCRLINRSSIGAVIKQLTLINGSWREGV